MIIKLIIKKINRKIFTEKKELVSSKKKRICRKILRHAHFKNVHVDYICQGFYHFFFRKLFLILKNINFLR